MAQMTSTGTKDPGNGRALSFGGGRHWQSVASALRADSARRPALEWLTQKPNHEIWLKYDRRLAQDSASETVRLAQPRLLYNFVRIITDDEKGRSLLTSFSKIYRDCGLGR